MAQQGQHPQADVLWQSQDGKKKFIFSLQAHRGSAMEQYAQFQGSQGEEGAAYAPLPELSPDLWEVVSGHVQTFMSNLGTSGYSVDLRVPMDILDPSLPDNTCRFGCGADESMLQQVFLYAGIMLALTTDKSADSRMARTRSSVRLDLGTGQSCTHLQMA